MGFVSELRSEVIQVINWVARRKSNRTPSSAYACKGALPIGGKRFATPHLIILAMATEWSDSAREPEVVRGAEHSALRVGAQVL